MTEHDTDPATAAPTEPAIAPAAEATEPTIRVRHMPDNRDERDLRASVRLRLLDLTSRGLRVSMADPHGWGQAVDAARRLEAYVMGEEPAPVAAPLPRRLPVDDVPPWEQEILDRQVASRAQARGPAAGAAGWFEDRRPPLFPVPVGGWAWLPDAYRKDKFTAELWQRPGRVASIDRTGWAYVDFGGDDGVGLAAVDLTPANGPDERRAPTDDAAPVAAAETGDVPVAEPAGDGS